MSNEHATQAPSVERVHTTTLDAVVIPASDVDRAKRLGRFFEELPTPIDHVLVTGPGPYRAPLADFDVEAARRMRSDRSTEVI